MSRAWEVGGGGWGWVDAALQSSQRTPRRIQASDAAATHAVRKPYSSFLLRFSSGLWLCKRSKRSLFFFVGSALNLTELQLQM